jgi:hypothetical protein
MEGEPLTFSRRCYESGFVFDLHLQFHETGRIDKSAVSAAVKPFDYLTAKSSVCSFMQARYGHPKIFKSEDLSDELPYPGNERRTWEMPRGELLTLAVALAPKDTSFEARMGLIRKFPRAPHYSGGPSLAEFFIY